MTSREALKATAARSRQLEAKAREQFAKVDTKADSLMRQLADSEWTIPALAAIALILLGVGVVIGRVF